MAEWAVLDSGTLACGARWLYFICMPPAERLKDLRRGFHRTFWIANTLELCERFAFYGSKAVLAVYLAGKVGLGPHVAGTLVGAFSGRHQRLQLEFLLIKRSNRPLLNGHSTLATFSG